MPESAKQTKLPTNAKQLRAWLRDTDAGREVIREATVGFLEEACRACHNVGPVPKVLVVVRRLGCYPGVEVFSEQRVSVRIEELVDSKVVEQSQVDAVGYTQDEAMLAHADNELAQSELDEKAMERMVEELQRLQLPRTWRHLPECRSDSMAFTGMTAERKLYFLELKRCLRELKESHDG